MNKDEARHILAGALAPYRAQTYEQLQRLLEKQDHATITADSGAEYQLEFHAIWDDRADGNIRVFGEIGDGGWRTSIFPTCDSFVVAPDGSVVGE